MKRDLDIAYIAGLFDGEGSVGIYASSNGRNTVSGSSTYWACRLSIVGTYRPMIEAIYNYYCFGSFKTQKRQAIGNSPRGKFDHKLAKQGWRWSVTKREEIALVLRTIRPFLIEKAEQADIVLKYIDGELDGEVAAKLCREAKDIEFTSILSESVPQVGGLSAQNNPAAKLTYDKAQEIRQRIVNGEKRKALVEEYGISQTMVDRIATGKTYVKEPRLTYH